MDQSTEAVRAFLVSMRPVREALDDLLRRLYKRPEVKSVHTFALEVALSTNFGLSADLHNGAVIDFWVELRSEDTSWQLEYSVRRHDPDEDGSHTEVEFPPQSIHSALDMPSTLIAAIRALESASANDALYR